MATSGFGYVYCMSNAAMPDIYKVGMTERDPSERLKEANDNGTWGPPLPYVIEFARKVHNYAEKEKILHKLMHEERINGRKEFFKKNKEYIRLLFALMDGEWWYQREPEADTCRSASPQAQTIPGAIALLGIPRIDTSRGNSPSECASVTPRSTTSENERKRLKDYFTHGMKIRNILKGSTLVGVYDGRCERIVVDVHRFGSIHEFVHHHEALQHAKVAHVGHWKLCSCEVNGQWVLADDLPKVR